MAIEIYTGHKEVIMAKTISKGFKGEVAGSIFENLAEDFKKILDPDFCDICDFCNHRKRDEDKDRFYCEDRVSRRRYSITRVNSLEKIKRICPKFECGKSIIPSMQTTEL